MRTYIRETPVDGSMETIKMIKAFECDMDRSPLNDEELFEWCDNRLVNYYEDLVRGLS